MKKMTISLLVGIYALIAASFVEAALPPFYQSLREYKALIDSKELSESLGSADLILDIARNDRTFVVTTSKHKLTVDIVYEPSENRGVAGPVRFHLVFHPPEPIKE